MLQAPQLLLLASPATVDTDCLLVVFIIVAFFEETFEDPEVVKEYVTSTVEVSDELITFESQRLHVW